VTPHLNKLNFFGENPTKCLGILISAKRTIDFSEGAPSDFENARMRADLALKPRGFPRLKFFSLHPTEGKTLIRVELNLPPSRAFFYQIARVAPDLRSEGRPTILRMIMGISG
jgi:hypothetical protein